MSLDAERICESCGENLATFGHREGCRARTGEVCWMMERGQSEGHSPTVWWTGTAHNFSADPLEGARFTTKGACEAAFCGHCQMYYPEMQTAREHVFLENMGGAGSPEAGT
jgi:hypothetical protein